MGKDNKEDTETGGVEFGIAKEKLSHQLSFENDNFEDEKQDNSFDKKTEEEVEKHKDNFNETKNEDKQIETDLESYGLERLFMTCNPEETEINNIQNESEHLAAHLHDGKKLLQLALTIDANLIEEEDVGEENDIFSIDITLFDDKTSDSMKSLVLESEPGYIVSSFDFDGDIVIKECQICYCSLNNQSVAMCLDCHYEVCFDCLTGHIECQVKDGVIKITCPGDESCIKTFSDQFIAAFSPEHIYAILTKNKVEAEQNPNIKTCPGCHKIERRDPAVHNSKKKLVKKIHCQCGTDWCFECYSPWHSGLSCAKFQNDVVRNGDKALRYWAKSKKKGNCKNAKKCPKCNFYIERITGCNHMTCNRLVPFIFGNHWHKLSVLLAQCNLIGVLSFFLTFSTLFPLGC